MIAASRNLKSLRDFVEENNLDQSKIEIKYFDATDFSSHQKFYDELLIKPNIVVYSAGFLVENQKALQDFSDTFEMMKTNYIGAVSILNIIATDIDNKNLERKEKL